MNIDKYIIIESLGNGNMGQVYKVRKEDYDKNYALKIIYSNEDDYKLKKEALENEFKILNSLDDRRIPYVIEKLCNDNYIAIVMEYIEGVSLNEFINDENINNVNIAYDIICQISDIVAYLHSQRPVIIYRDFKPENFMIGKDGVVRLIDFGTSLSSFGYYKSKISYGTYGYCSPEQVSGNSVSAASDIYSIGGIFYYILTGVNPALPPFKIEDIDSNYVDYDPLLAKIVNICHRNDPNERYKNALILREELSKVKINIKNSNVKKVKFSYYLFLILQVILVMISLYSQKVILISLSIILEIISYLISKILKIKYNNSTFIRKRCYNILWTEKKYIGL